MPAWSEVLQEVQTLDAAQDPQAYDKTRRKYLAALGAHTKRDTILYASKWIQGSSSPASSMVIEDLQGFMECVHGAHGDRLDLILHLPGGQAEATEAIVNYIRQKFRDVRVIVPLAAMSAATLLTCSANAVVMGKHSYLGPIDPQMAVLADGGVTFAPAHAILQQFERAKEECRKDPQVLGCWLPMLKQYGPALLERCRLADKLSRELAGQWLEKYMLRKLAKTKRAALAATIADKLAKHDLYFSHGRFLSRNAVRKLGMNVIDLEKDQTLQDLVLSVLHATTLTFDARGLVKLIENDRGRAFMKIERQIQLRVAPQPAPGPTSPAPPAAAPAQPPQP